ncbi:MAG: DegT/DnrJ/EryC1/StrS family aminotransferase [Phycisphaerales bacterium]|nr:DegT/DnrJ/EryC1/StrS family aminotransferase [Phycisphaerales bacterium]
MPDIIALVDTSCSAQDLAGLEQTLDVAPAAAATQLESSVAELTNQSLGVATTSLEDAACMLLRGAGVGAGDEVAISALSDPRIEAAVHRCGARSVHMDVDPSHLGPRRASLDEVVTGATKAVIAGPVDGDTRMLEPLAAACVQHEIAFYEFVGPWLGTQAGQYPVGGRGRAALVDLGAQVVHGVDHTGVVVTSDDTLAQACMDTRAEIDGVSPAAPSGLTCQLAWARLKRLDDLHRHTAEVAEAYVRTLAGLGALSLPAMVGSPEARWSRLIVRLDDDLSEQERDEIITGMRRHDIEVACAVERCEEALANCPVARGLSGRLLALPLHGRMTTADATLVAQTLDLMIERATFHRS